MYDQTTEFTEGETVYVDSRMSITKTKVISVKSMKTRGGIRYIVRTEGGGDYDGAGHPRTRDSYSTVTLRKATPEVIARYNRLNNDNWIHHAYSKTRDWNDEESELIADAVRVADQMRKQRKASEGK